jgi:hypothetical protein
MSPLLRDGDVVLVQAVAPESVRVGDAVLCSSQPGRVVLHRVVRTVASASGRWLTVQGDQLARPDGVIPAAQIYGRAVTIRRNGVQIELDRPVPRLLGKLAALRSRWNLGRSSRFASRLLRAMPGLSRYLA